jgi:hypothetical protein
MAMQSKHMMANAEVLMSCGNYQVESELEGSHDVYGVILLCIFKQAFSHL